MRKNLLLTVFIVVALSGCQKNLENYNFAKGGKSFERIIVDDSVECCWGYDESGNQYSSQDTYGAYNYVFSGEWPSVKNAKQYLGEIPSKYNPHYNISAYRYFFYNFSYNIRIVQSLDFIGNGLCEYKEVWTTSDPILLEVCTRSDKDDDTSVGTSSVYYPTPEVWNRTDRLFNVLESSEKGSFILYEGDTYIDAYVDGNTIHLIKRIPSVEDMGVFALK